MGTLGRTAYTILVLGAVTTLPAAPVLAAMGAPAIMDRLHPKQKGRLTMDEVRDAVAAKYDVIAKANGGKVSLMHLGGRVSAGDLKAAQIGDGEEDEQISKADYLALAERFFAQANVSRKPDVSPADGTLSTEELGSPAGKKLVGLLE